MRFEAMHKIFKSYVNVANFAHLCLSLSERYLKSISEENITDQNAEHPLLQSR